MNVDTSSTATIQTSQISNSQQPSRNNASQVNDNDFSKELKKADSSKVEDKEVQNSAEQGSTDVSSETTDSNQNSGLKESSSEVKNNDKVSSEQKNQDVQDYLQGVISTQVADESLIDVKTDILTQNIQELVNAKTEIEIQSLKKSVPSSLDYSTISMSDEDAQFFVNLVHNTDMTMQTIATQIQNDIEQKVSNVEQKVQISAVLMNTIQEGMKTNQPFRIDFGNDVSVILRIDKDGSVNANFIPGDKAVEQYLKNNIGFLKQRFDDEKLSYGELTYSQSRNQNRQQQERKNKEKE